MGMGSPLKQEAVVCGLLTFAVSQGAFVPVRVGLRYVVSFLLPHSLTRQVVPLEQRGPLA